MPSRHELPEPNYSAQKPPRLGNPFKVELVLGGGTPGTEETRAPKNRIQEAAPDVGQLSLMDVIEPPKFQPE